MDTPHRIGKFSIYLTLNLGTAFIYWLLAKVGLFFALNHNTATIFWPAGGFGLAILLLGGLRYLPGVYLGALLAGLTTGSPPLISSLIALGNALESFCGFWLLTRCFTINRTLDKTTDLFRLLLYGAALSSLISALIGPVTLTLSGAIGDDFLPLICLRWWMADALGIAFATPLILIWSVPPRFKGSLLKRLEMVALFVLTVLIGHVTFLDGVDYPNWQIEPSWLLPLVIWSGLRAGRHLTALLQLLLFTQSIWGATHGIGYYADSMAKDGLVNFWLFSTIIALGGMILAILRHERRVDTREQQRLHKTIAASLNEIYLFDAKTLRFTFVNRGALENLGYTLEEMKTLTPLDLKPEFTAAQFQALIAPLLSQETNSIGFETFHQRKDGTRYPIEVHLQLFEEDDERYFNAVILNISERKQAEMALLEAKRQAEESARLKSEFLANMSHEIRTPMNAIVGISELMLNKELSPQTRQYLERIRNASDNLLAILNDILDFSKVESGCMNIENIPFDLDQILVNLGNLFSLRAEERQIKLKQQIDPEVPRKLVGDALRIQQVLTNLLSNAIKFTVQGQVNLTIRLIRKESHEVVLEFAVEDTGIGISSNDIDKLFLPFSQVDGSISRRFGGTGLGLAISQRLLGLMNSSFDVHSKPGMGSRFSFRLTLNIPSYIDIAPATLPPQPRRAGALTSKLNTVGQALAGRRILVVEDNETNRLIIQDMLELAGIGIETATTGKQAIEILAARHFDAVLMDIHMPEMDGIEATSRIRRQLCLNDIPIIALTAGVTSEERKRSFASGIDDFIAKPFSAESLVNKLSQWISDKPRST